MTKCERCGAEISVDDIWKYQGKCEGCYNLQFEGLILKHMEEGSYAVSLFKSRLGEPGDDVIADKGDTVFQDISLILGKKECVWYGTLNYTKKEEDLVFCATYLDARVFIVRGNEVLKIITPNKEEKLSEEPKEQ